jgi:hypothetical protein
MSVLALSRTSYVLLTLMLAPLAHAQSNKPAQGTTERGPVTVTVSLSAPSIRIGDTLTFTLQARALTGVELILPEFGQSLERHTIVDFVPNSQLADDGALVETQRYILRPANSGDHILPPLMVEFVDRRPGKRSAPDGEDAYEVLTQPLRFTVTSVIPKDADDQLHPAFGTLEPNASLTDEVSRHAPWLMVLLVLIVASAWWLWQQHRQPSTRVNPADAALNRINTLRRKGAPNANTMDAYFVAMTDIVRRYVEDRFGLHAPELTTEEFLESLVRSPDLSEEHQRFLREFLSGADQVKFARHVPSTDDAVALLDSVAVFVHSTAPPTPPDPTRPEHVSHA